MQKIVALRRGVFVQSVDTACLRKGWTPKNGRGKKKKKQGSRPYRHGLDLNRWVS